MEDGSRKTQDVVEMQDVALQRLTAVGFRIARCWQERQGWEGKAHSGGDDVD